MPIYRRDVTGAFRALAALGLNPKAQASALGYQAPPKTSLTRIRALIRARYPDDEEVQRRVRTIVDLKEALDLVFEDDAKIRTWLGVTHRQFKNQSARELIVSGDIENLGLVLDQIKRLKQV